MIEKIIAWSVRNSWTVGILTLLLAAGGAAALVRLPIDAVPDVTTNQVDVITNSPNLSSLEIERYVTTPVEMAMANLPGLVEIRSTSRFGSSVVKLIFTDETDTYLARQLVFERLGQVKKDIPEDAGDPILGPMSTGLGEIYQYVLRPEDPKSSAYTLSDLRTIQDWQIRKRLLGLPGVADVSGYGGYVKEYQAKLRPERMQALGVTVDEVYESLAGNNDNTGGAYIEKNNKAYTIRGIGLVDSLEDIRQTMVKMLDGKPVLIQDVAEVGFGHALRFGALTMNGEGEVVGGSVLMMKGANGLEVIRGIKARMEEIQRELPPGLVIEPFIDRSKLVNQAIQTVAINLIEGALIVILIILLLLGNWRASLLAASVIPLSMLFAFILMNAFGVVGNIMSLGAIDFGLLVDPAIIVVESVALFLAIGLAKAQAREPGRKLTYADRQQATIEAAQSVRKSVVFGGLIILIVYFPILTLQGVEGKMFAPMAKTVAFAIIGALLLSITYVPMMSALIIQPPKSLHHGGISGKIMEFFERLITPVLSKALRNKPVVVAGVAAVLFVGYLGFSRIGGEFIPKLQEGDLMIDMSLPVGTNLTDHIEWTDRIQKHLMQTFPDEIERIVSKIGTSEVKVEPLPLESQEMTVVLKDKSLWKKAKTQEELAVQFNDAMMAFPGIVWSIQQPIEGRVNDMMSGARTDVVVQLFGPDLDTLTKKGNQIVQWIKTVDGAVDVQENKIFGLPQINIHYNRAAMAVHGVTADQVNRAIQMAFGGAVSGVVYEQERKFELTLRLTGEDRTDRASLETLMVTGATGNPVPIKVLAQITEDIGPSEIGHENLNRRVNLGFNVRGRDLESVVQDVMAVVSREVSLPEGYTLSYGGEFENFSRAKARLALVVPISLLIIFGLLYLTFGNFRDSLLIYAVVPLSAVGGVFSLLLRDMNFSISAGVGFIALFGVAVLNGILLVSRFNELGAEGVTDPAQRVLQGVKDRLRPVLMTSFVAAFGFLPMALSTRVGAEVQKPLATVVIGGLLISTLLTLIALPVLYALFAGPKKLEAQPPVPTSQPEPEHVSI